MGSSFVYNVILSVLSGPLYRIFIDFVVFLCYPHGMEMNNRAKQRINATDIQSYRLENSEYSRLHFPYEKEDAFTAAVEKGEVQRALEIAEDILKVSSKPDRTKAEDYYESSSNTIGIMSHNEKKHIEYTAVAAIALTTRAAIRGGLDPFLAYDISDLYLQRLSEEETAEEYLNLMMDSIRTFLSEIQKTRSRELTSIHALHARQYIGQNLNKPLSLEIVAEAIGLSPSYLSAIFKQNEGIGLKQYITRQRIDAAKNLLLYSDAEIGTIASYVGFCSQSHFGKTFKDITGMTPNQFRRTQRK